MKTLLVLVILALGVANANARDCTKLGDYAEMPACYEQDAQEAREKIAKAYEDLLRRLGTSTEADMLARSQKAWLEYQSNYYVSCPRIFWTPICPTGGIHGEVEHEPNRNQRCE